MIRPISCRVASATLLALVLPFAATAATAEPPPPPPDCAELPYVENVFWTTPYGPAAADVVDASTNMLPCTGAYALCFYAGPEPMTCTVAPGADTASCECYALETSGKEVYYVDINAILNTCVYLETVKKCGFDGAGCQETNSAPVCGYIQDGTFSPGAELISTYSTAMAQQYGGVTACTECASATYAGCMTAPCTMGTNEAGESVAVCECPLATRSYQVGQDDVSCELPDGQVWSAAYNTAGCMGGTAGAGGR